MLCSCSFLCIERYKFQSPKNIMIPLSNITSIDKVRIAYYIHFVGLCRIVHVKLVKAQLYKLRSLIDVQDLSVYLHYIPTPLLNYQ